MAESPPTDPKPLMEDPPALGGIEQLRQAREDAARRVARRNAEAEPDTRRWRTGDDLTLPAEPIDVL